MNQRAKPYLLVVFLCLLSPTLFAQGVRMSADFIPLEVGNRWVYEVVNENGQKIGDLDFSIQEHRIMSGRSFYVLTRFPFVEIGRASCRERVSVAGVVGTFKKT